MIKLFLPILLVLHLGLLSQLIFTAWPEMLTYPYLLSSGFSLYRDFIYPYPPGLVLLLATVFNIFDFNPTTLKIFTWVIILTIDTTIFFILKRITTNLFISLFFLTIFIFLQSFLEGNMLWFDLAIVQPLLLGFYFALKWIDKKDEKNLFLTGLFLGLSVIIKQTAFLYLLAFIIFYLITIRKIQFKQIFFLVLGPALLFVSLLIYLLLYGSFNHFINWTLIYPFTEWSKFPGYVDFLISKRYLVVTALLLLPLGGAVLSGQKILKDKIFLLSFLFLGAALLAVYPRFSFFHLQPAIALTIIIFTKIYIEISPKFQTKYLSLLVLLTFIVTVLTAKVTWGQGMRFYSLQDQKIATKIASEVKAGEKVFLLGVNASEYVFSRRLPPRNWTDNFGWYLEIPGVQEWVIEGLKEDPPQKVVWRVPSTGNWYKLGVYQPQRITQYIRAHYRKTGNIEEGIEIWSKKD